MGYRLPPLNTLRLFEAAGRHLSFKLAAESLHVTPSAVSHGIQSLEDWLGVPLFHRTSRGLALTEAGAAYLPCVQESLSRLAAGSRDLPGATPTGKLAISSAPTFAARWLIPNLPRFRSRNPNIEVLVDTSHRRVEFPLDGFDVAIRFGADSSPRLDNTLLVRETLFPVCAPRLLSESNGKIDLARAPLIHVTTVSEEWAAWVRGAKLELDLDRGLRFDTIHMALDAAMQGLGVAIGRAPLVDADIATDRLVRCHPATVEGTRGHWLVCEKESLRRPEIAAFRSWMLSEVGPAAAPARTT